MQFDFENPFHRPLPEYVLQKQKMDINGHEFVISYLSSSAMRPTIKVNSSMESNCE